MAANIDQIFQEFILNKIREIEVQNEDKTETPGVVEPASERGKQEDVTTSSQKKHKKHKKHKSKKKKKKKKRNQDREKEISSGCERGTQHRLRRGTSTERDTEQGDDSEKKFKSDKYHTSGKRKKKKRRRKAEDSSDSDTECASTQRDSKLGQRLSPRLVVELPDIIPKQDSSNKARRDEESNISPPHSQLPSHSTSERRNTSVRCSQHHFRSRSCSLSRSHPAGIECSSSEAMKVLDDSSKKNRDISRNLQPCESISSPPLRAENQTASDTELQGEKPPETKEEGMTSKHNASFDTFESVLDQSILTKTEHTNLPQSSAEYLSSLASVVRSSPVKKRKPSKSPQRKKQSEPSKRHKRSRSSSRKHKRRSRSRTSSKKRRSRSRSRGWRSRRSRSRSCSRSRSHSRSVSRSRRRAAYSQRDRWKREPSHSPILVLRKNRSPTRKHSTLSKSPQRISELDKEQLLEIAKANAAAMCAKAGMPIPASLRTSALPFALPSMAMNAAMASMTAATMTAALSNMGPLSTLLPLPSITNKPPPAISQPIVSSLEEAKRMVAKQANSISIKEFTDKCKMIVDSKGELPVALPHVSDEEDNGNPFGGSALREPKAISFSINNTTVRPTGRSDAGIAKEFPVSSGSQHRKKEGEVLDPYGEWVPVEKTSDKDGADPRKFQASFATVSTSTSTNETMTAAVAEVVEIKPVCVADADSVFPDPILQPVDISQAVTERIKAQRLLAENPYDVHAICMLSRAQEQVDAWAQSNTVPGLFTGSTGAQVLSSEELSNSGPQAWLKKDQFLRAAPVSGGVGELLMRKMGWRTGEGLGRNREGTVEPIIIDFKVDRKGLVAEGEKAQKQTGGLVVTKDLMGKHPVSALIELCNKQRILQPEFVMVHHSGPDHRKNFLFKVTVNGVDYQPQAPSPNKKHAKAMAATVALQALGEVPVDGPGLYTGPVFTAASTGPLFST
eukprot:XP_011604288.1 PREDICTED: protein SON-like [Takifugu rubripes]